MNSRNHIKRQKIVITVVKNLKMNMLKIIVRDNCHYTEKHKVAVRSICNLKYNAPKEISIVFQKGSSYDYHFIKKS